MLNCYQIGLNDPQQLTQHYCKTRQEPMLWKHSCRRSFLVSRPDCCKVRGKNTFQPGRRLSPLISQQATFIWSGDYWNVSPAVCASTKPDSVSILPDSLHHRIETKKLVKRMLWACYWQPVINKTAPGSLNLVGVVHSITPATIIEHRGPTVEKTLFRWEQGICKNTTIREHDWS